MVVCSPAFLSRSSGALASYSWATGERQEYILGRSHAIYSHTHTLREFEVSNQIKVHISRLWEETGVKAHTGPGVNNICKHYIGSKPKPKPSRQEATGLITARIKPEI